MSEVSEAIVQGAAERFQNALAAMAERVVGQRAVCERLLMGLVGQGHVLLEGLPGLAKTTAVKTLAAISGLTASRIQFTPDLLPADVIGTQIYDPKTSAFRVKKGPVFANVVIADEINRAPAKVQAALLEAMQERQVTIGEETFRLEEPFLVMATQNPIEQDGTYPLPEAQCDRFLFKVKVGYGTREEEKEIMARHAAGERPLPRSVLTRDDIFAAREMVHGLYVAEKIRHYIVALIFATRDPGANGFPDLAPWIAHGASPRASLGLDLGARLLAFLRGRNYVTPQDVKDVAPDVLRHRLLLSYEAEAEGLSTDAVIAKLLARVEVP